MNLQVGDSGCDCLDGEQEILSTGSECVCTNCGRVVVTHVLDNSPEWFDTQNARADFQQQAPTYDLRSRKDAIDPQRMPFSVSETLSYIRNFAQAMRLPPTACDTAGNLLAQFYDASCVNNRRLLSNERYATAACCLYFSCKMMGHSRSIKEVSRACAVNEQQCVSIAKQMKTMLPHIPELYITVRAKDLLVRSLQLLDVGNAQQFNRVLSTCHKVNANIEQRLEGRTPECICGVCIYCSFLVHGIENSIKSIAKACMVSPMTLSKSISLVRFDKDMYVLKPTN